MFANNGVSLRGSLRFEAPWLGAEAYALIADARASAALPMPWLDGHQINVTVSGIVSTNISVTPQNLSVTLEDKVSSEFIVAVNNGDSKPGSGYEIGLVGEEKYQRLQEKLRLIEAEKARVALVSVAPSDALNELLVSRETSPMKTGCRLVELLKRPQLSYDLLAPFDPDRPDLPAEVFEQVEISIKYEGYIKRQFAQAQEMRRLESKKLDETLDYRALS